MMPSLHAHPAVEGQDAHHDYNFSGTMNEESYDTGFSTDDEHLSTSQSFIQPAASRHSSVSSFPASVVHHSLDDEAPTTPSRSTYQYARATTPTYSPRPHSTGFRHPSSVRALQMQDEFETTDYEEPSSVHRRRNSKLSYQSYRSSGSYHGSPVKSSRMSRSVHGSPGKSKLKQEFPLVLLHCTLLQPALTARAKLLKTETNDKESVLEAIIPETYVKRWKTLQDKVVRNTEVKSRGVLIPHPRDEYELLEERLLESLELERPKIREGHYLSSNKLEPATDSGFESGGTDTDSVHDTEIGEDAISSEKCPDCGHNLSTGAEQERKWEVKVFAANGLMRAGAWVAAWNEMEKIDVEVSVWMPEDVRREVDARLEALIAKQLEEKPKKKEKRRRGIDDERAKEIYGDHVDTTHNNDRSQAEIDGLDETHASTHQPTKDQIHVPPEIQHQTHHHQQQQNQPDIPTILINYFHLLAQDRRNIAILLLSMLVIFYGVSGGKVADQAIRAEPVLEQSNPSAVPEIKIQISMSTTAGTSVVAMPSVISEAISTSIPTPFQATEVPEAMFTESEAVATGTADTIAGQLEESAHALLEADEEAEDQIDIEQDLTDIESARDDPVNASIENEITAVPVLLSDPEEQESLDTQKSQPHQDTIFALDNELLANSEDGNQ